MTGTSPFSTHGTFYADIKGVTGLNGNVKLETADFAAAPDLQQVATMSAAATNGAWSTGALTNGIGAIAKAGNTQFRMRFATDDNNDGGGDYLSWSSGDDTNSAYWPVLEVVYSAARAPSGLALTNRATGGTAKDSQNTGGTQGADKAFDGVLSGGLTKWYNGGTAPTVAAPVWLGYDFGSGNAWAITRYDITSANDVQARDPKDWTLKGSSDGSTWTTVDTRSGEVFATRGQTKQYLVNSQTRFRYYRLYVTANYGGSGYGVQLAELAFMAYNPPVAPTGLAVANSGSKALLSWAKVPDATGYTIKRATISGGPYTTVASGVTLTTFADTGASDGVTYYYVVSATGEGGESGNSAQTISAAAGLPGAPPSLSATAGVGSIALGWAAAADAASYKVKRAATSGGSYTTVASGITGTAYTDSGLTNGTTYYYVVSGVNAIGEGANSSEASATPAISLTPLEKWRLTYFQTTANTGNAADSADSDRDGLPNLLEYALGGDPSSADSAPTPFVSFLPAPASTLRLTFLRARADLTYVVQGSSNLVTWIDLATNPGSVGEIVEVNDSADLSITSRRFLRLKVIQP